MSDASGSGSLFLLVIRLTKAPLRFDFMGHMAFTHDFGMLETGRDPQGLNMLIEKALLSVPRSHIPECRSLWL